MTGERPEVEIERHEDEHELERGGVVPGRIIGRTPEMTAQPGIRDGHLPSQPCNGQQAPERFLFGDPSAESRPTETSANVRHPGKVRRRLIDLRKNLPVVAED